ncbi:MAG: hypothetical protein MI922_05855, partial [Bacteroidales bacterium]|nr:hypothetical protein [Bacteroidales bacterium]
MKWSGLKYGIVLILFLCHDLLGQNSLNDTIIIAEKPKSFTNIIDAIENQTKLQFYYSNLINTNNLDIDTG